MLFGAPYKEDDQVIQEALKLAQQKEPLWTSSVMGENYLWYDKPDGTIDAVVHPMRYESIK